MHRPGPRILTGLTVAALLLSAAPAMAAGPVTTPDVKLKPRTFFTMAADGSSGLTAGGAGIPNIDSVKKTIANYYGDPGTGIANKSTSPYISEMTSLENAQTSYLNKALREAKRNHTKPAIVFDADDTTLMTYDMEVAAMHFNFDPVLQNQWVQDGLFPATPGMVAFANKAQAMGFAIFGLTGRSDAQKDASVANLQNVGYTGFNSDNFFTKYVSGTNPPSYLTCVAAPTCTTVEYKAGTRKHIEQDLGYDIVLNIGDQWSDLQGGYADRTLKLPNPTYYLPSPNLPGVSEPTLAPRTQFTMAADGSSGLSVSGERIPNIDSVKSTIRAYYGATSAGIANKDSSPYITEVAALAAAAQTKYVAACKTAVRRHQNPAIVFDADDTTLWTYDMEDGAMKFNFNPVVQDTQWVQPEAFPAVPGMVSLVNAVGAAGCTVVGITGRNSTQRDATLGNLAKVGYTAFTPDNYYTKWAATDPIPSWATCTLAPRCTTIEYKSQARAHVESMGYTIIANFGDQFSDLIGAYSKDNVKLPNPTYYLP